MPARIKTAGLTNLDPWFIVDKLSQESRVSNNP